MDGLNIGIKKEGKKPQGDGSPKKKRKKQKGLFSSFVSILITAVIVGGGIYAWQSNSKDKSVDDIMRDARNTRESFEKSLKNLEGKIRKVETENEELKTKKEELEEKVSLVTDAIKVFEDSRIGVSFTYPALFGDVHLKIIKGSEGNKFEGSFSNNPKFVFGGSSSDYLSTSTASTSLVSFLNFSGIEGKAEERVFKTTDLDGELKYKVNPAQQISFKGGDSFIVDAKSFVIESGQKDLDISLNVGAILNIDNEIFPGLAFLNSDLSVLSLENYRKILSSIELIK